MIKFTIKGNLGGPEPDGFVLELEGPGLKKIYSRGAIKQHVYFTPDEFRQFWHDAGEALAKFDEMAGEPSSDE